VFVPGRIRFTESELREAVADSRSCAEVLRKLGLRPAGGNHLTVKKYVVRWGISTAHFDQAAIRREALYRPPIPLADLLVERSTYNRGHLKRRLLAEGSSSRSASCAARETPGAGARWRSFWITSTACRTTTGWRTSGSSARIAQRRSTRIVAARTGRC